MTVQQAKAEYDRQYYSANRERIKARARGHYAKNRGRYQAYDKGRREIHNQRQRRYYASHREALGVRRLWAAAKLRAAKREVPFTLTVDQVRHLVALYTHCPILGVKLVFNTGRPQQNSYTLDAVIPSLGYIIGNVAVLSFRANAIKNDGTAGEHEAIATWMRHLGAQ